MKNLRGNRVLYHNLDDELYDNVRDMRIIFHEI